jgi:septum formation protein
LRLFSARRIEVFTGLYLIDTSTKKAAGEYDKSYIYMEKISNKDINRYFSLLGPYDKAGGFSIEGAGSIIFDNIRGSYFNILGLPMAKLAKLFKKLDLDILDFIKNRGRPIF